MKINRHNKAKILTQSEIQLLFNEGFKSDRDRALFGVCLYTACRINEASTLNTLLSSITGREHNIAVINENTEYHKQN